MRTALRLLAASALVAGTAFAAQGPDKRSFRALSMGNAFVAVVDDGNALYYNPAGLNLINSLGNRAARPALSAYPRNRMDARLDLGGGGTLQEALGFYRYYEKHQESFGSDSALLQDDKLISDSYRFYGQPITSLTLLGGEFAMHNYGGAFWFDVEISPSLRTLVLPKPTVEKIRIDGVFQLAGARAFVNDRLAVGVGYRLANRQQVIRYRPTLDDLNCPDSTDTDECSIGDSYAGQAVQDSIDRKLSNLGDLSTYGHGIDVGVLWQQTSWLRLGAAVQNVGMVLDGELINPEFTVGAAFTPPLLSAGGMFARRVNFAVDVEDLFAARRNYKPLSKLNFGGEVEQYLWWIASVRAGGGFKGGYWTAGGGLTLFQALHVDFATWADEAGYYTGHIEERYYAAKLSIGI